MGSRIARLASGYRRTTVVGTASVALVLLGLGPAAGAPAGPSAASAAPFSNGMAKATALVTRVAPGVGSLELAIGSGIAVSELKNQLAQAQAQSFDLGLIGTTLTAGSCRESSLTADDLPQPTRVDNRKGDASASSDEAPVAGSTLGGGREVARATTLPSAASVATTLASTGDAVSVSGGRATAETTVIDGVARQAHATAQANISLAGIVELSGLRWDAIHRTGEGARAEATFDIGTAELLGAPIPLESLAQLETVINTALAPTGITVEMPRVERFTEPTDLVRITPLRIALRDSELGKTALGPGLNASRTQREQLFDELSAAICDAAGILLVGDIGLSVVSGTGFLLYEIGGAEAISGDFVAGNPFGSAVAPGGTGAPLAPGAPPAPGAVPAASPPADPGSAERSLTPQPAANVGPLEELCQTIHPSASPGCSEGALAPLGLLGLLATGAIAALDWRHQRRRLAAGGRTVAA